MFLILMKASRHPTLNSQPVLMMQRFVFGISMKPEKNECLLVRFIFQYYHSLFIWCLKVIIGMSGVSIGIQRRVYWHPVEKTTF